VVRSSTNGNRFERLTSLRYATVCAAEVVLWFEMPAGIPVMNDLVLSKHHLTPRHQLMSSHRLIKLLRLTRLAGMSAINSVSIEIVVRSFFLSTPVSLLVIYKRVSKLDVPLVSRLSSSELVHISMP
jgi:hypothetical protein